MAGKDHISESQIPAGKVHIRISRLAGKVHIRISGLAGKVHIYAQSNTLCVARTMQIWLGQGRVDFVQEAGGGVEPWVRPNTWLCRRKYLLVIPDKE